MKPHDPMLKSLSVSLLLSVAATLAVAAMNSVVRAQELVISEFLARNGDTLADEDGATSDWVELYHAGTESIDLSGWRLVNSEDDSVDWSLPAIIMSPGEFLLVFASGKDRADPRAELHTDFQLRGEGEFLSLVDPLGNVSSRFAPYPLQISDVSFARAMEVAASDLLPLGAPGKALVTERSSDLADAWRELDFDDSAWIDVSTGVGYDRKATPTFREEIATDVGDLMQAKNASIFLRLPFEVADPASVTTLVLRVQYDSGFVAYLGDVEVARRNADSTRVNATATSPRAARIVLEPEDVPIRLAPGTLRPGRNVLAVQAMNDSPGSQDFLFAPRLQSRRVTSMATDYSYFTRPTPGLPNVGGSEPNLDRLTATPSIAPAAGEYSGSVTVTLEAALPFPFDLHYTVDGTAPTSESSLYDGPFQVETTTAVRAAVIEGGERVGRIATRTYLIGAEEYDLPILSLAMDPGNFRLLHLNQLGSGRASERSAHMELFDNSGELAVATGMGLRLHGGRGRGGDFDTKKSYRMYFRGLYGDRELSYPVFDDELGVDDFDKLVLRANFNDRLRVGGGTLIRDQLARDLHGQTGSTISRGTWWNLFVNGQYRGVYNVVERLDAEFLSAHFPESNQWYAIKTNNEIVDGGEQTQEAWSDLLRFFRDHDISDPALLDEAMSRVDVASYTPYIIINTWLDNGDWPLNNWFAARSAAADGRWTYVIWDAEFGFSRDPTRDRFGGAMEQGGPIIFPFASLLESLEYQQFFAEAVEEMLRTTLSTGNVVSLIDRTAATIRADISEEVTIPDLVPDATVDKWEESIEELRDFARQRPEIYREQVLGSTFLTIPRVLRFEPDVVTLPHSEALTLFGFGFTEATSVTFDGTPSPRVEFVDANTLRVMLPSTPDLTASPAVEVNDPERGRMVSRGTLRIAREAFRRGDANGDGSLNVTDVIAILRHLFVAPLDARCDDALDANDSGHLDLEDPIALLNFLFLEGSPAIAPYPGCGADATEDDLGCSSGHVCADAKG